MYHHSLPRLTSPVPYQRYTLRISHNGAGDGTGRPPGQASERKRREKMREMEPGQDAIKTLSQHLGVIAWRQELKIVWESHDAEKKRRSKNESAKTAKENSNLVLVMFLFLIVLLFLVPMMLGVAWKMNLSNKCVAVLLQYLNPK